MESHIQLQHERQQPANHRRKHGFELKLYLMEFYTFEQTIDGSDQSQGNTCSSCSHDEDVLDSRVYEAHLNIMRNNIVRLSHRRRSQSGLRVLTSRSRGGDVKSEAGECSATFILFIHIILQSVTVFFTGSQRQM